MPKPELPLTVEIPKPGQETPGWSRVGVIALLGFVVGIAWPRVAGMRVGPAVPLEARTGTEASAAPHGSSRRPGASASTEPSAVPAPSPSDAASTTPLVPANQEMVLVGPGKITKCWDKRDKKIEDCEKLLFDPIATKRLQELARCPAALGLAGKISIGFEVNFDKKEVQVKSKKGGTSLPSSTVAGVVQCAGHEFGNVSLEEVPHKHKHYSLVYGVTFYPPGKHPEGGPAAEPTDGDPGVGATTSESEASGTAIIAWDTALLRKDPKDGDVVARIVRGTKVKIVGRQSDWYKIESGSKAGWVYRGAIGL